MNDSTPENIPETPVESQPAPAPQFDARRRLRELLSTPERDRTDEQWDEIIELEIQLAPGNRVSGNEQPGSANQGRSSQQHGKPGSGGGGGQQQKKHRPRTNNNRRPRQNKPQSGGGGNQA